VIVKLDYLEIFRILHLYLIARTCMNLGKTLPKSSDPEVGVCEDFCS